MNFAIEFREIVLEILKTMQFIGIREGSKSYKLRFNYKYCKKYFSQNH